MACKRKNCPMRHENGNCLPIGGFCTAVNDPICEALHSAYDRGFAAGAVHAKNVKKAKTRIKFFACEENLAQYTDSMLYDSGTCIASMSYKGPKGTIYLELEVRGAVEVDYKGHTYTQASDFPAELIDFIRKDGSLAPIYDEDDNVVFYVSNNNWFEYIYHSDVYGDDGIMCEDVIAEMTVEELKIKMYKLCEKIIADHK